MIRLSLVCFAESAPDFSEDEEAEGANRMGEEMPAGPSHQPDEETGTVDDGEVSDDDGDAEYVAEGDAEDDEATLEEEEAMEEEEGGRENRAEEERGMLELEAELPLEELLRRYREMAGGEDEGKEQEEDEGGSGRPADLEDDRVVKDLEMAEIKQPEDLKGASQAAATTQPTGNTLKTTRVKVQPAITSSPPPRLPPSPLFSAP